MAYYYVKNTGSSTTSGGTTKQTGAFSGLAATAVYGSVADAITYGAGSGDFICVSASHSLSTATTQTYTGPTSGAFLHILEVEDANCETPSTAATALEYVSGGTGDLLLAGRLVIDSVHLKSDDNIQLNASSTFLVNNCTFEVTGANDFLLYVSNQNITFVGTNCTFTGVNNATIQINGGGLVELIGGSITGKTDHFTSGGFFNGGGVVRLTGFDLSSITGTVFNSIGGNAAADDLIDITLSGCKLNAIEPAWFSETLSNYHHHLEAGGCSGASSTAEYRLHFESYGGVVDDQDSTGIHRDETTVWPDSGEKTSLKITTNTNASKSSPFHFRFPARYVELSAAASDVITIYLASTATLYDSDVYVVATYPDGTTKNAAVVLSTQHTNVLDINGSALTPDIGSTWLDGVSAYTGSEYKIDIDTSGTAGADCVPSLQMYVAIASTVIYVDPVVGLS